MYGPGETTYLSEIMTHTGLSLDRVETALGRLADMGRLWVDNRDEPDPNHPPGAAYHSKRIFIRRDEGLPPAPSTFDRGTN